MFYCKLKEKPETRDWLVLKNFKNLEQKAYTRTEEPSNIDTHLSYTTLVHFCILL
jgi:hypothetical protein